MSGEPRYVKVWSGTAGKAKQGEARRGMAGTVRFGVARSVVVRQERCGVFG